MPLGAKLDQPMAPERVLALLEPMLQARALEERTVALYRQGVITGGCYTGIGNEATSVGAAMALRAGDVLVPTHRDMGAHLVRGHAPLVIMRQYMKRATSQTGGKDSGLHLGQEGTDIVGMISPLAHMMPVAAGIALAERQRGREIFVLTTIGDGSTSLGDFHETLNFAAVHKLPMMVMIENNQYAYSTPNTIQYACERLSDRAQGYGMVGKTVDGTDALEVLAATEEARARALSGEGPTLIESVTMRMRGHSEHDDFKYVPPDLLEAWKAWDPLARIQAYVLDHGLMSEGELAAKRATIQAGVEAAVQEAMSEPEPEGAEAGKDVFRRWDDAWTVPEGTLFLEDA